MFIYHYLFSLCILLLTTRVIIRTYLKLNDAIYIFTK